MDTTYLCKVIIDNTHAEHVLSNMYEEHYKKMFLAFRNPSYWIYYSQLYDNILTIACDTSNISLLKCLMDDSLNRLPRIKSYSRHKECMRVCMRSTSSTMSKINDDKLKQLARDPRVKLTIEDYKNIVHHVVKSKVALDIMCSHLTQDEAISLLIENHSWEILVNMSSLDEKEVLKIWLAKETEIPSDINALIEKRVKLLLNNNDKNKDIFNAIYRIFATLGSVNAPIRYLEHVMQMEKQIYRAGQDIMLSD